MKKIFLASVFSLIAHSAWAANHQVQMLDIGADKAPMVFEPAVLHIAVGDSVTFLPTNKGHNVESKSVPEGAEHFKSELDQEFTVTLDKEGIYLYTCPPHSMMNMNGVIIVGKPVNLEESKEYAKSRMERRAMSNKGRLMQYLDSIDSQAAEQSAEADKNAAP